MVGLTPKKQSLHSKSMDKVRDTVPLAEVAKEDIVRVNLNVPESTRTAWKLAALEQKMSLADLVIKAVNTHLGK